MDKDNTDKVCKAYFSKNYDSLILNATNFHLSAVDHGFVYVAAIIIILLLIKKEKK